MLVQIAGESELRVVRDRDEWELDPGLHARSFQPDDRLIDSAGIQYHLVFTGSPPKGRNTIQATGQRHTPGDVQALAERHMKSVGAEPEWLAGHLRGIADSHKIRATILYLAKLAAADLASSAGDEE